MINETRQNGRVVAWLTDSGGAGLRTVWLDQFSLEKPTAQPRLEVRFLAMGTGAEAIVRPARQQAMGEERDAPVTRYGVGAGGGYPTLPNTALAEREGRISQMVRKLALIRKQ
jgi:hypothetical protein